MTLADGQMVQAWFNLPAIFITAAVTVVLVIGIKESAGFNAAMVLLNIGVILAVVGIGAAYVDPKNWQPFLHEEQGLARRRRGGGPDLLRLHRVRLDLDARRGGPPAAARPGDRHHGGV